MTFWVSSKARLERDCNGISPRREIGLIIQKMENSDRLFGQDLNSSMIVLEWNWSPFQLFLGIFSLFDFENDLVEMVLETFVGKIYTKLFETVFGKVFKSEQIEQRNDTSSMS